MELLQKVKPQTNPLVTKEFIKDDIQKALELSLSTSQTYELFAPTQEEIQHVSVLFKNRKLDNINVITYKVVSEIAKPEFVSLNNQLKQFTSKISSIKAPGLFTLLDELSKGVSDADLEQIWERTVNAKPSLMARIFSVFNPKAIGTNLQTQYESVYKLLTERSKGLEVKLGAIEKQLIVQKHEQENNIAALTSSFEMYFNSFQNVRTEFIFTLYLEEFYKQEIEKFKLANPNLQDLQVSKQLSEYESVLNDIENKRLVLHGALIKFPIIVKQNENLINVSKNILKEIDNTLLNNFTSIRSNLMGLGISLNAQQALLGTNQAKLLDEQSSKLSSKIVGDLSVKAEKFASESRLREAENIKKLVGDIRVINDKVQQAKEENKADMQKAQDILNEATQELKQILGQN